MCSCRASGGEKERSYTEGARSIANRFDLLGKDPWSAESKRLAIDTMSPISQSGFS